MKNNLYSTINKIKNLYITHMFIARIITSKHFIHIHLVRNGEILLQIRSAETIYINHDRLDRTNEVINQEKKYSSYPTIFMGL